MAQHQISQPTLTWQDGEPFSEAYGDIYFSRSNGLEESRHIFIHNSELPSRWHRSGHFCIAETGFGTGLNFLATLEAWFSQDFPSTKRLTYLSVELHPLSFHDLKRAVAHRPELARFADELLRVYPTVHVNGWQCLLMFDGQVTLMLGLGDAADMYEQMDVAVDAWFLDGFAPGKNPRMWSDALFAQIGRLSKEGTSVASFTVAGTVRRGLQQHNFSLRKPAGFGGKRENLAGVKLADTQTSMMNTPWFARPITPLPINKKIIVVGGGIAGVTTAHLLSLRGFEVHLFEQYDRLATQGSGNRAGLVLPKLTNQPDVIGMFYLHAFLQTVQWLDDLKARFSDLSWHKTGVLLRPDKNRFEHSPAWLQEVGVLREMREQDFPWLAHDDATSLQLCEQAGWLQPSSLINKLIETSPSSLQVKTNIEVREIQYDPQCWTLFTSQGEHHADAIVLANASGIERLSAGEQLPLFRNLGQLAYLPDNAQVSMPVSANGYIIPGVDGNCVLGASYEHNLNNIDPQEKHRQTLRGHWQQLVDASLADGNHWQDRVGERFTSRDHLPLVGPLANVNDFMQQFAAISQGKTARYFEPSRYLPNLYVNVAHGSRGLVTAYFSALYLAELISCGQSIWPRATEHLLHPSRFWVRELRKGPRN
ncbi:MAG: bifunctional tRNA (5-methylaminomethyl-2-thiouridine)(34)-methyltransferase MnmD/FAD-dependent 5-carboxymethylaminomethyl-2-thiouridine(34) oxidoreductase MnmC [Gammaproteobacteria bacterium]|nr:bifunctional tRNA (5-methylaminomethyl-2-thiouridine)(34)-methyltransferase MnmD/FAD-dependent 5-carboxymethylaminomethyl-2-thiouridine(34) oxidoreductase MnmC [Gammaproteobacteria bacterium]